jgi:equilibrative nucleoside transporter 1/2/3
MTIDQHKLLVRSEKRRATGNPYDESGIEVLPVATLTARKYHGALDGAWETRPLLVHPASTDSEKASSPSVVEVFQSIWSVVAATFLTYLVTLSVFPVITSQIDSVRHCETPNRFDNDLFTPITFVVFNVGDLLGRYMTPGDVSWKGRTIVARRLVYISVLRIALVPLFLLTYSSKSLASRASVRSDMYSWTIQVLLALSNGWLTSMSFSCAPGLAPSAEQAQKTASAIMQLCVALGILCGSFFSYPLLSLYLGTA